MKLILFCPAPCLHSGAEPFSGMESLSQAEAKQKSDLETLYFFSAVLQIVWQNSIISRQLKLGIFGGCFSITLFDAFFLR